MTDRNSDPPNSDNQTKLDVTDLDWLAFCYVADELSPDDRTLFETRLVDDELAQQSVVDAVQQSQVLYSSLNSTSFDDDQAPVALAPRPVTTDKISRNRVVAMLASAAAILVLVSSWGWFANAPGRSDELASSDSDRLASAWVATLVVMNNDEHVEYFDEDSPIAEINNDESEDWMLVALTELDNAQGTERESN